MEGRKCGGGYDDWQDQQQGMKQAKFYKAVFGRKQFKVYTSISKREKEQC